MLDDKISARSRGNAPMDTAAPEEDPAAAVSGEATLHSGDASDEQAGDQADDSPDESIVEEIGALIEDAELYARAELAFQKTRAKIAGRTLGAALAFVVLAIILLHIALIALAVGFVIALAPLVTIWGAIAIVVGLMLVSVLLLASSAAKRGRLLTQMFSSTARAKDHA